MLSNIQFIIPRHCEMSVWSHSGIKLPNEHSLFLGAPQTSKIRSLPGEVCYLLWIFYQKFLNEVLGRLWNWWKCFCWIIHVNLRYVKVSFLIISSHKWRFLCQQHVWNHTYVPEIRTQCIILLGYLNNTPPIFIVLQIKFPVRHTQRIRNITWHLSFMQFKHVCACIHKESCVYLSRKAFLKIAYVQHTLFLP